MSASEPSRYLLLVNPSAGGGRVSELLPTAEAAMAAAGLEHRTVITTGLEHGCEEALAGAAAGEIPVVMSGDGLIGQVGGVLADGDVPMGVIPGGRGNDLARMLAIPGEIDAAVGVLAAGAIRGIDVGVVNGKRFLCIASCGFDSDANRIANEAKWIKGNLVYAYAALRALIAWKPATFTLEIDGDRRQATGYSVAACNSKFYGGGMYAAPDAEIDDGLLDVEASGNVGKLRFLRGLGKVFKGEHREIMEVQSWRGREVRIEANRPFAVYADGDHIADLPATVTLLPRALKVIVPAMPS
ncbi:MAG: diacylglycerol/lipid kinase family protein [Vicinamibacteria bacterium]|jgi:YegS/Rv2252/BmrU family lipid kinase